MEIQSVFWDAVSCGPVHIVRNTRPSLRRGVISAVAFGSMRPGSFLDAALQNYQQTRQESNAPGNERIMSNITCPALRPPTMSVAVATAGHPFRCQLRVGHSLTLRSSAGNLRRN